MVDGYISGKQKKKHEQKIAAEDLRFAFLPGRCDADVNLIDSAGRHAQNVHIFLCFVDYADALSAPLSSNSHQATFQPWLGIVVTVKTFLSLSSATDVISSKKTPLLQVPTSRVHLEARHMECGTVNVAYNLSPIRRRPRTHSSCLKAQTHTGSVLFTRVNGRMTATSFVRSFVRRFASTRRAFAVMTPTNIRSGRQQQ